MNKEKLAQFFIVLAGCSLGTEIWQLWYTDAKREAVLQTLAQLLSQLMNIFPTFMLFFMLGVIMGYALFQVLKVRH